MLAVANERRCCGEVFKPSLSVHAGMDLADRVQDLEDRVAITERLYQYGYRLDDRDWAGWAALFAEDAVGHFEGWGTARGRDEIEAFGRDVVGANFEYSAHVTHQPVITVDGDHASATRYLDVYYVLTDGTAAWRQGRYEDEFIRQNGEWRFSSVTNSFRLRREWRPPSTGSGIENIEGYGDIVLVE